LTRFPRFRLPRIVLIAFLFGSGLCAAPDSEPQPKPAIPQTFSSAENTWYKGPSGSGDRSLSERFNQMLPKWLRFSGELRERSEGYDNLSFRSDNADAYDLQRLRLGMRIAPTSWMRFYVETQDARAFAKKPGLPPYQKTWGLRQAYATLGSAEGSGFGAAVSVGRMEMNYGNGRLVGNSWWTNVSRSFDGVRATLNKGADKVDIFASSVVIIREGVIDHHNQGNNLNGFYGHLENYYIPNSVVEPYGFWHLQHDAVMKNGKTGHLNQFTWGFRLLGVLPANFDYRTEIAVQRGTLGPSSIQSWMGHWTGGYTVKSAWLKPRLFVEYDYASGDRSPKDISVYSTFDPIYPSTHDKLGLADQIGMRNIRDLRFGQEYHASKKWTLATSFHDFWLADARDSLYPTRGSVVAQDPTGHSGTHVGEEFDAQTVYRITPQFQAGGGFGRLFTGEFLNRTTKGKDYSLPYLFAEYVF